MRVSDVREQRGVEFARRLVSAHVLGGAHLAQHVGVAADRALAEDDQAAREDVGAFHRDADRHHLVAAPDPVVRPEADTLAAVDIHRVVDHFAHALGHVVLGDGGDHRWLLARVDRARGHHAGGVHQVAIGRDPPEGLFDPFELADRGLELAAHPGVGAGIARHGLRAPDRRGRQRDRAPRGQAAHQHHPALARVLAPADDPFERHEHVLARIRPVLEHRVQRQVAAADLDPGVAGRHQRASDAEVLLAAEQALGIVQPEGQAEQRRYRPERDVALVPRDAHAEHFLALVHAAAHDGEIRDRRGVRARLGAGKREARDFQPFGQARQVVILLLFGAVLQQQLGRPERVRHHHAHRGGIRARGELHHHRGVRQRRELQAAVLLRDDHAEKALVLHELPHVRREVLALMRDLPVVAHCAQLFARAVDEGLLFRGELRRGHGEQLVPVRTAGKQVAVPPHGAGVDRLALGLRHVRQDAAIKREQRIADYGPPQRADEHQRENECGDAGDDESEHDFLLFRFARRLS